MAHRGLASTLLLGRNHGSFMDLTLMKIQPILIVREAPVKRLCGIGKPIRKFGLRKLWMWRFVARLWKVKIIVLP